MNNSLLAFIRCNSVIKSLICTRSARTEYINTLLDYLKIIHKVSIVVINNRTEIDTSQHDTIFALGGYTSQGHFESSLLDLLLHVAGSTGHEDDDTFAPLPSSFFDTEYKKLYRTRYFRSGKDLGSGTKGLKNIGLLDQISYDMDRKVCYGFRLPKLLASSFSLTELFRLNRRGLSSAKLEDSHITIDTISSINFDKRGIIPDLSLYKIVLNKLGLININKTQINNKFKKLLEFDDKRSNIIEVLLLLDPPKLDELHEIARKYLLDSAKLMNVFNPRGTSGDYTYTPRFVLNSTGRLTEVNGIQGITKLTKKTLHTNRRIRNYDIRASQMCALLIKLDDMINIVDIDNNDLQLFNKTRKYLVQYVNNPKAAEEYADRLNIGRDDWKRIIYSVVFGSNYDSPFSTASDILISYKNVNLLEWEKIKNTLFASVYIWTKYIRTYSIAKSQHNEIFNGIVKVSLDHPKVNDARSIRWLSAFWLQGIESKFIFEVIALMSNKLISYEYDGIIVEDYLDPHVIEVARVHSGFHTAQLVEKSFDDSSSTPSLYGDAIEYFEIDEFIINNYL